MAQELYDKRLVVQNPTPGENSFVPAFVNFLALSPFVLNQLKPQHPRGVLSEEVYNALVDRKLPSRGLKQTPSSLYGLVTSFSRELKSFDVTRTSERHESVSESQILFVEWTISEQTSADILEYLSRHHNSISAMVCCLREDYATYVKLDNGQWMMTCDWLTVQFATDEKVFGNVVTQGKAPVLVLYQVDQGMTISSELQQRLGQLTGTKVAKPEPVQPSQTYDKTRYHATSPDDEKPAATSVVDITPAVQASSIRKTSQISADTGSSPVAAVIDLPQPPIPQDDEQVCEYCSYRNESGFLHCMLCTKKRDIPLSQQPVDLSNAWKCRNCSTMTNLDSYICRSCGKTNQAIRKQIEMKEGKWICVCNTVNSGIICDSCFKSQPVQWKCKVCDNQNYTPTCIYCETEEPTTDIDSSGDVWPCEKCTLRNPMTVYVCNGCGEWNMNVYDLIRSQEAAVAKQDWKCVKCGNENRYYSSSCSMCFRAKALATAPTTSSFIPGGPTMSTRTPVSATHHPMSTSSRITTTSPTKRTVTGAPDKTWNCKKCFSSNSYSSARCYKCRTDDQSVYQTILDQKSQGYTSGVARTTSTASRKCSKCYRMPIFGAEVYCELCRRASTHYNYR